MTRPFIDRALQSGCKFTLFFTATFCLVSCGTNPKEDQCCIFGEIPPETAMTSGQGSVQVAGTTDINFYVLDKDGKQVGYQSLNNPLGLNPGTYSIKVNNSIHPLNVKEGKLITCGTGTIITKGTTGVNYYILDTAKYQLSYDALEKRISLFAGYYIVKVNNSEVQVDVKLNETIELQTGSIIVHGSTSENYYVLDTARHQLSYDALEKGISLFPGSYVLKINDSETDFTIESGKVSEVQTGTLIVHGTTGENYYVVDATGRQLSYNSMDKPLAFLPSMYQAKVSNSLYSLEIKGGETTEVNTGTLLVKGRTEENYYVHDTTGTQLSYAGINKPIAFFAGSYKVKVNNSLLRVTVTSGAVSEYITGSLVVAGSGTGNFYVLDGSGAQLTYSSMNKPIDLFPGDYIVRVEQKTQKVTVRAGQLTTMPAF